MSIHRACYLTFRVSSVYSLFPFAVQGLPGPIRGGEQGGGPRVGTPAVDMFKEQLVELQTEALCRAEEWKRVNTKSCTLSHKP